GADLRRADLRGADLRRAVLRGAVLRDADLRDADLRGAVLRDADLRDADLTGADLRDAVLRDVPVLPNIDAAILAAVTDGVGELNMSDWHMCETTHCRAGWAVHLAGKAGKALEEKFGPAVAGSLIYAASRPGKPIPDFYASTSAAMADIRKCAEEASCS
ncbi:pentapeptide repeat-containing protein, partial [Patescibacteria group bacterium]